MWTDTSMSDDRPGAGFGSEQGKTPPPSGAVTDIERLRDQILACDRELIRVLGQRRDLVREVGELKASLGFPVTDPQREATVVRRAAELARTAGLDEELVRDLIWKIMASARDQQNSPAGGSVSEQEGR